MDTLYVLIYWNYKNFDMFVFLYITLISISHLRRVFKYFSVWGLVYQSQSYVYKPQASSLRF